MKPFTLVIAAALLVAGPATASAQRIDVGGSASTLHVPYGEATFVSAGPLVTYHFNDRHALQVATDLRYQHTTHSVGINGIYSVQYRRTFKREGAPTALFLTAGGVGGGGWHRVEGFSYIDAGRYEGDKWVPGTAQGVGWETRSRFSLTPPWVPVVGAGIERDITPRVALRGDVTAAIGPHGPLWLMGVRGSAGAIVRLGKPRK